jgi:hypothetical protein
MVGVPHVSLASRRERFALAGIGIGDGDGDGGLFRLLAGWRAASSSRQLRGFPFSVLRAFVSEDGLLFAAANVPRLLGVRSRCGRKGKSVLSYLCGIPK